MGIRHWIDRTFYPDFGDNWDDLTFRMCVLAYLRPTHSALDLGAGVGKVSQMKFRGMASHVAGIDPDPRVLQNPNLDSRVVGCAERLPYENDSFDVVFSDNVFEHLPDPSAVMKEVRRVLRPEGYLLLKTPNRRHYVPTLARLTPHRFHRFVNGIRGRSEGDTFPTLYRANSAGALRRAARGAGLRVVEIRAVEGRPEYLRVWWPLYLLGLMYERAVNSLHVLEGFRVVLIAVLQKQQSSKDLET